MSDHDPHLDEDAPDLAAEHALGVLDADARRAAEARIGTDAAFRAELRRWEDRLAPLADEVAPVAPSETLWPRIEASTMVASLAEARLVRGARPGGLWYSLGFWRGAAAGLGALAAACLVFAVTTSAPPATQTVVPGARPMMVAEVNTPAGAPMLVVSYDPDRKLAMVMPMPGHEAPSGHAMQLWLIPADGQPRSLGVVGGEHPAHMLMPSDMAALIDNRATLAVTVEAAGGSPTGRPTSQPVASGALNRL